jgi:phosphatidylglycerol---prolipoprotein diacylglyceryl transferase
MHLLNYIQWDPSITLVDLGFFQLRWYSLLFATGFILSYMILSRYFQKENVSIEKLDKLTVYIVLATIIGARLGHVIFYDWDYYSNHLLEIFLPFRFEPSFRFVGFQGLASHGGSIAILIAVWLYRRNQHLKELWTLDKLALVVPLAGMFIRLGNLMNSEIIGKPAEVPWAFVFEQVDNVPRHPGQLYEAIAYLLIFGITNLVYHNLKKQNGFVFGLFLVLLFSARFIIEFFKTHQSDFEIGMTLNMGQILSIPFIIFGLVLMFIKNKNVEEHKVKAK